MQIYLLILKFKGNEKKSVIRREFCKARIIALVKDEVSNDLFDMLVGYLQGFCGQMQIEMAEDLLDFAIGHVVHTTGCQSVDVVLDYCYSFIAMEHGIFMELEN